MLADARPALELIEARPDGAPVGAPVLFVHGAFGGAWMWRELFLPLFARRGRTAVAVSLRGHGASEGRRELRDVRLTDYLDDLRRALALFSQPPVVIGHSLGGLLAQMLIGREEMRGLVLAASLPPEGMLLLSPRLAVTDPFIWIESFLGTVANRRLPVAAAMLQLLFSEGLPRDLALRYASMMTPEAPHALADAHLPQAVLSAALYRLPTLVVAGDIDRIVWRASTLRTALYHGAAHRTVEGLGHLMMLDLGAERVARLILDWLDDNDL
jgi:pimeloyl-ACP methyl ester carboxylesterase